MSINPDALKLYRTYSRLSQADLAAASKVSKKTISRIETGEAKADGIRQSTIERLAKALRVEPGVLAAEPRAGGEDGRSDDDRLRDGGLRVIADVIDHDKALAYELITQRYDIPMRSLFEIAPLCFTLLAELSLKKRRERLAEIEAAFECYSEALPRHLQHGKYACSGFDNAFADEETSLRANDLFGAKLPQKDDLNAWAHGFDPNTMNPFLEFLAGLAKEINDDKIVAVRNETEWSSFLPQYSVCERDFSRLTGGDARASFALLRGYAHVAEVPQKLLGDGASAERIAWLAGRVPQAKWEEEEKRHADLMRSISGIDLDKILGQPTDARPAAPGEGDA